MSPESFKRKLTAILSADVKGYSRLMGEDEVETIRTLEQYREIIRGFVEHRRGRVVDSPGDNLLAEFASVVDAVESAMEIQKELKARNAVLPENRRMEFRIGINLGDVVEEKERIYGDGVNIAARIEGLAEGGGICVSGSAFEQVKNKLKVGYEYLGEQSVKNIAEKVRVYRVIVEPEAAGSVIYKHRKDDPRHKRSATIIALSILIAAVAVIGIWHFYWRSPKIEPASKEKMVFPLPNKPSIAVLPFVNMTGDPGQEFFCDGVSEDIITALSKVPRLFVIARNSAFSFKGKPVKVQKVSEELGVQYVLEGSVQKSGDRVRVTAQLIDALKGHHLWAERFERDFKDVFAIQDSITKDIITALNVKLTEGEQARVFSRGTENLEAYLRIMEARWLRLQGSREGVTRAKKLAEEAIALDPKYALAYSSLGSSHMMEVWLGLSKSPKESLERNLELQKKAVALDNTSAIAHASLGNAYAMIRQYDQSIAEGEKAYVLEPNTADVLMGYGTILCWSSRFDQAIPLFKEAMRLDPKPPAYYPRWLSIAFRETGKYDEAIEFAKKAIEQEPNDMISHGALTAAYAYAGREEEARAAAKEILRINPKFNIQGYPTGTFKDPAVSARIQKAFRTAGLPDKPPLPLPDKPSIAVLPFVNMSEDKSQEYFSDGMTEDLITDLSKISGLFVIARNSTFVYKGKPITVQQVSRELGVKYVLEGSVRRAGDQVRINAQLVDATTGQHLWAERYDGIMRDVFSLQDKINQKIVAALTIKLTPDDQNRIAKRGTEDSAAHDAFLKGWDHYLRFTSEDALKALSYFKEAVELDSNYGRAHAAIALVYWHATGAQGIFPEFTKALKISWLEARLRACQYLEIAMKNPVSITHALQSERYLYLRLYEEAISEAEHALALDPNDPASHAAMANALIVAGKPNEAIDYARNGLRLDPQNPARYLNLIGNAHFFMGELKEAVNFTEDAIRHNPTIGSTSLILAASYAQLGRDQEARAVVEASKKIWTEHVSFPYILPIIMYFNPFRSRPVADALAEGLIKAGVPGRVSDYIHGSEEDLLTGDDLREFVYPSTITGFGPGGSQWSADFATDGKVTLRAPWLPGGVDTGRSWLEGDRLCFQLPKNSFGMVYCGVTFRNPKGTPEGKNEYARFTDIGINIFSRVR